MNKQPLGVTFTVPPGQEATDVYESDDGIETFETNSPYILTDGVSLQPPLPIKMVTTPVFIDSMGGLQKALAIKGVSPPVNGITWDNNTPWDNNTYWS